MFIVEGIMFDSCQKVIVIKSSRCRSHNLVKLEWKSSWTAKRRESGFAVNMVSEQWHVVCEKSRDAIRMTNCIIIV